MKKTSVVVSSLLFCSTLSYGFNLKSLAEEVVEKVSTTTSTSSASTTSSSTSDASASSTSNSSLSSSTISSGLKSALKKGVEYAVDELGADGGYLNNAQVSIPLPENLQKVESAIRKVGGDEVADNLITSMNTAATKAAPETAQIFVNAIEKMSVEDAQKILNGGDSAATDYFKTNTTASLKSMITPIIQETMQENKVAGYYDTFNAYYKQYGADIVENSQVVSMAKNLGVDSYIPSSSDQNLDDYVADKAIEGLFTMIAEKEAAIRSNPVEQTTSLLKQVFGN
jgi:hypothetical protein